MMAARRRRFHTPAPEAPMTLLEQEKWSFDLALQGERCACLGKKCGLVNYRWHTKSLLNEYSRNNAAAIAGERARRAVGVWTNFMRQRKESA